MFDVITFSCRIHTETAPGRERERQTDIHTDRQREGGEKDGGIETAGERGEREREREGRERERH